MEHRVIEPVHLVLFLIVALIIILVATAIADKGDD